ncbi:MAG: TRAP transporter large permease [Pseudomonadota bacterium]|nr:TRAP transporter large permease [Pseudomonadota bacterium]
MDPTLLAGLVVAGVLLLLALRVPIAYALGACAIVGLVVYFAWRPGGDINLAASMRPVLRLVGANTFSFVHSYPLSMIPLFIGLGHVAYHAEITTDLYRSLRVLLRKLPGGLAMASVSGCAGFSAITGSSVACAAAMGKIAVPEMLRYGYHPRLASGAVAAGGTLGSLIPPSLLFVIYAIFTEQSVNGLFLAGVVPGLLSLVGFLLTICLWCLIRPSHVPKVTVEVGEDTDRLKALSGLWPSALLFSIVVGGIYLGIFTPTEAAAVSLIVATLIGIGRRKITWSTLIASGSDTVRQTAMIFMVALAAKLFTAFISLTRITPLTLDWLQSFDPPFYAVMIAIVIFYLVIGMFLDSIGILVLTLPFTVPIMLSYDVNLIWFGVIVIKLLEIGLITPPIGLNIFVIKSVSPKSVTLSEVIRGSGAFLVLDFVVLILLLLIPALSLWLPNSAFG